jgi:hypothetical protein
MTPANPTTPPPPAHPPRWFVIATLILRLIWPLAMLGAGVMLAITLESSTWLWPVLGLLIVCGIFARPPQLPREK